MRVLASFPLFHGDFVRGRPIIRAPSAVCDSKERDKKFSNTYFAFVFPGSSSVFTICLRRERSRDISKEKRAHFFIRMKRFFVAKIKIRGKGGGGIKLDRNLAVSSLNGVNGGHQAVGN